MTIWSSDRSKDPGTPALQEYAIRIHKTGSKDPMGISSAGNTDVTCPADYFQNKKEKAQGKRNDSQQYNHKVSLALPTSSLGKVSGPLLSHGDGETGAEALLNSIT